MVVKESRGQKSQAERYIELQKFEQEVKTKIMSYIKNGNIDSPELQEYLKNIPILVAPHILLQK